MNLNPAEPLMETPCIIPYAPRPLQWRFHQQRTRFCVLLCHRRFGKTVAAVNDLLRAALRTSRTDWRAAYAAPYLGQAKAVAWDYLRHFAGVIPGTRFHEGELRCDLPNGARIRLYGTDNAQALRGLYLDDLVLDEPADMPREVWSQILRPALADRQGRALFCGTPKGCDNLLYDVWQLAGSLGAAEGWSRFRFPASQTGYLPQAELDAARRGMNEAEYRQEFECSFAAAVRGAYYAALLDAADLAGRICPLPVSPDLPVHTAWDLGMDDATAIWFFQVEPSGAWRMLDYYEASGEGLAHYAAVLAAKARPEGTAAADGIAGRGFCYGRHLAPHDIRVRELGTGQSRLESAARLGIRFGIAPSLPLADGIDAVRRALPRLWFDSRHCAAGLAALRSYRRQWRPRQEQFSSGPLHDGSSHAADALRYAVTGFRPLEPPYPQPEPASAMTCWGWDDERGPVPSPRQRHGRGELSPGSPAATAIPGDPPGQGGAPRYCRSAFVPGRRRGRRWWPAFIPFRDTANSRSPYGTHENTALRPGRRAGRFPSGRRPGRCGPESPFRPHVPGRAHGLRHVCLGRSPGRGLAASGQCPRPSAPAGHGP